MGNKNNKQSSEAVPIAQETVTSLLTSAEVNACRSIFVLFSKPDDGTVSGAQMLLGSTLLRKAYQQCEEEISSMGHLGLILWRFFRFSNSNIPSEDEWMLAVERFLYSRNNDMIKATYDGIGGKSCSEESISMFMKSMLTLCRLEYPDGAPEGVSDMLQGTATCLSQSLSSYKENEIPDWAAGFMNAQNSVSSGEELVRLEDLQKWVNTQVPVLLTPLLSLFKRCTSGAPGDNGSTFRLEEFARQVTTIPEEQTSETENGADATTLNTISSEEENIANKSYAVSAQADTLAEATANEDSERDEGKLGMTKLGSASVPATVSPPTPFAAHETQSTILNIADMFALSIAESALRKPWQRLYSSAVQGRSFNKILSCIHCYPSPTVLIVSDPQGRVFGAFTDNMWKEGPAFYGPESGSSAAFLFRMKPSFKVFRSRGSREPEAQCYQFLNSRRKQVRHGLGMGGSIDQPRLFLDENLEECKATEFGLTFEMGKLRVPIDDDTNSDFSTNSFTPAAIEVWGIGGIEALLQQQRTLQEEHDRIMARRKVDRKQFASSDFDREFLLSKTFSHVNKKDER